MPFCENVCFPYVKCMCLWYRGQFGGANRSVFDDFSESISGLFFLLLFSRFGVHFWSHVGSFWASIFDRHLDGFLDWIWGGLGGPGFESTRGVRGFEVGLLA